MSKHPSKAQRQAALQLPATTSEGEQHNAHVEAHEAAVENARSEFETVSESQAVENPVIETNPVEAAVENPVVEAAVEAAGETNPVEAAPAIKAAVEAAVENLPAATPAPVVEATVEKAAKKGSALFKKRWLARSVLGQASLMPSDTRSIDQSQVVHLLVKTNPKRAGTPSASRFSKYVDGMTIAAYVKAASRFGSEKVCLADIAWDLNHGFIKVSEAAVEAPAESESQAA